MEGGEMSLEEEEDLDISLETEDAGEFEEPAEEVITESVSDFDIEGDDEEISLDMDKLQVDDNTGEFKVSTAEAPDEALDKGAEAEFDLEDLDLDLDLEKSDD
jgi:hypothetical protein